MPDIDKDQISVYLPEPLGQRVRDHAARLDRKLTEVCTEAIERYMNSPEPRLAELEADNRRLRGRVGDGPLQEMLAGTLSDRVRKLEAALAGLRSSNSES